MIESLDQLLTRVRACTQCRDELPLGPRPVLQANALSRVLIVGQAPGSKVHATGVPFDDPSGDRLRDWMGVDKETFYDAERISILPMGFCYPGKGKSGDLPPIPRCAELWRLKLLQQLTAIRLTLVIGQYAQAWHLPRTYKTLTETVRAWREFDANVVPMPHPSPRNNIWLKKNHWFESDLLPVLRKRVKDALRA